MARLGPDALVQASQLISCYPDPKSALLPLCHLAQAQDGWLTPEAMEHIAELVGVIPAEVLGTASFYDMLHTKPIGKYLVAVCTNIACLLAGGQELLEHAEEHLGVPSGGTTEDGQFTLEEVECVAFCDKAPCAAVNWRYFGPLTNQGFDSLLSDLSAGKLAETVPPHGVLSRVGRSRGLAVSAAEVAAERSASDQARAERAAQAAAAAATAGTKP
jgi:NADH-quinone oxidoreductase subunit E